MCRPSRNLGASTSLNPQGHNLQVCNGIDLLFTFYANINIMWKQYVGFLIYCRRYVWHIITYLFVVCFWRNSPQWAKFSLFTRFLDHTQRRTAVGRTPLDEWSTRRRDLYHTSHNTHNRQTTKLPLGLEPTISASKHPKNQALHRAESEIGIITHLYIWYIYIYIYIKQFLTSLLTNGSIYIIMYSGPQPTAYGVPLWRMVS